MKKKSPTTSSDRRREQPDGPETPEERGITHEQLAQTVLMMIGNPPDSMPGVAPASLFLHRRIQHERPTAGDAPHTSLLEAITAYLRHELPTLEDQDLAFRRAASLASTLPGIIESLSGTGTVPAKETAPPNAGGDIDVDIR